MTSFISSSKSSRKPDNGTFSKPLRILMLAVLLVILVEFVTQGFSDDGGSSGGKADLLTVQPEEDGIYLLGNSMFKTGIDVQLLDDSLPNDLVDFEYHNGHYTNLWYLIAKSALPEIKEVPSVIVWGYRPRYALDPAFRQNRLNATDLFAIDDPIYNSLSASGEITNGGAGDFIAGPFKSFNDGYIPRTAEAISDLGIPQVVIIWRPVAAATGELSNAEINFVSDSLEYFSENSIPVLNLFNDEDIGIDFFASGDHYNAAGREYITLKLANFLQITLS